MRNSAPVVSSTLVVTSTPSASAAHSVSASDTTISALSWSAAVGSGTMPVGSEM